jgi:superfamily II DNA or RNA helicase
VIAMFQTLASREYPASTFSDFHLLIVDECHHVGAKMLTQALFGLAFPRVLGLSATPTRKDRLTDVMHWFLGPTAYLQQREHQSTTLVRRVPYSCPRYSMPPPVNCRGDIDFTGIITSLVADSTRTSLVARHAVALCRAGRDVLVLSHRREHCKQICAAIVAEGVDASTYLGGDKFVPDAKVIVATFSLVAEGFDCPRLSALVLATPASDVEQACGRVMRGSVRAAVVVDVVDQWGVCFAQASKRKAVYRRSGFTIRQENGDGGDGGLGGLACESGSFAFLADDG